MVEHFKSMEPMVQEIKRILNGSFGIAMGLHK